MKILKWLFGGVLLMGIALCVITLILCLIKLFIELLGENVFLATWYVAIGCILLLAVVIGAWDVYRRSLRVRLRKLQPSLRPVVCVCRHRERVGVVKIEDFIQALQERRNPFNKETDQPKYWRIRGDRNGSGKEYESERLFVKNSLIVVDTTTHDLILSECTLVEAAFFVDGDLVGKDLDIETAYQRIHGRPFMAAK